MNGDQKRGLQAGYKCITLYMHFWLSLLIITIIIIIIIVIIVFQLKQSAIIKQALIGLGCVAWALNYLITCCARETRKGERRPPLRVSMGLTDRRKTAKNLVDSRKNGKILTVSRKLGKKELTVKEIVP